MSKRKNFYYVLVLTNEGPTFVTGIPERNYAEFDKLKKPMVIGTKSYADEISMGLTCNFITAYTITLNYELSGQPYRYNEGKFEWKWDKDKDNKEEK